MCGLAIAGQRGVEDVVRNVLAELDLTMPPTVTRDLGATTCECLVPHPLVAAPHVVG
jgi:hypothetical protein